MNKSTKRLVIIVAIMIGIVAAEQSGAVRLSYARRVSGTHTSDQVAAAGGSERTFELVSIDYPWARWLPLVKFGETVICHNYRYSDGVQRQAVTRTRLTVFGLISTREYEAMARRDFEAVSVGYKKGR